MKARIEEDPFESPARTFQESLEGKIASIIKEKTSPSCAHQLPERISNDPKRILIKNHCRNLHSVKRIAMAINRIPPVLWWLQVLFPIQDSGKNMHMDVDYNPSRGQGNSLTLVRSLEDLLSLFIWRRQEFIQSFFLSLCRWVISPPLASLRRSISSLPFQLYFHRHRPHLHGSSSLDCRHPAPTTVVLHTQSSRSAWRSAMRRVPHFSGPLTLRVIQPTNLLQEQFVEEVTSYVGIVSFDGLQLY